MPFPDSCKPTRNHAWFAVIACGLVACGGDNAPTPQPVDYDEGLSSRVSVSGVSAGGYMAVQSHVALADRIGGVGAIAAGPYHCAGGDIQVALGPCMTGRELDAEPMIRFAGEAAAAGGIASTESLRDARVWVFHSPADAVVSPAAGDALVDFYAAYVADGNVVHVNDIPAAHGWVTADSGSPCEEQGGDFINDCDYDAAGTLLQHLYGELDPRVESVANNLEPLDLSGYFPSGSNVSADGLIYVPAACRHSYEECRLHIAFHGCVQGFEFIGDRFATQVGLNEWAESNRIVVVYPQLEKSLFNPKGCWDWWGYSGDDYDQRSGSQVSGVAALIDAFASGKLLHDSRSR
jgi:poly(3-hydroxybutyrate) depolymerase